MDSVRNFCWALLSSDHLDTVSDLNTPTIDYMGCTMVDDTKDIDYVMVFPQPEDGEMDVAEVLEAQKLAKRIFLEKKFLRKENPDGNAEADKAFFDKVNQWQKGLTRRVFHQECVNRIAEVLTSKKFGLEVKADKSYDGDELILRIKMPNEVVIILADRCEIVMPVHHDQYAQFKRETGEDLECPKIEHSELNVSEPLLNYAPMHQRFSKDYAKVFVKRNEDSKKAVEIFRQVDKVRLIVKRMQDFFLPEVLVDNGIMTKHFPVHKWDDGDPFMEKLGWPQISFTSICRCSFPEVHKVRDYFGEETAFFFHWLTFLTRMLLIPGLVSVVLYLRKPAVKKGLITLAQARFLQMGFATWLMFWASIATAYYNKEMNLAIRKWGMDVAGHIAPVLPTFKSEYRKTYRQSVQNGLHWVLAFAFIVQAVFAVFFIQRFRRQCKHSDEDDVVMLFNMLPVTAGFGVKLGKYLITIDIKITAALWGLISPRLTSYENWRTEVEAADAQVFKNFLVKAFVYYYPFFYLAFIKEQVEGCGSPTGCVDLLSENLVIFFVFQVITAIGMLLVGVLLARYLIRSEIAKVLGSTKIAEVQPYNYSEAQAKLNPYPGSIDSYTEFVLAFGFITMFGVVCPIMAAAAVVSNAVQRQLNAYMMVKVYQRPFPKIQQGIGAWGSITSLMTFLGAIINVALACFSMHPIKDNENKALIFIAAEHAMLMMMVAVPFFFGEKKLTHELMDEENENIQDEILSGVTTNSKNVKVPKTYIKGDAVLPLPAKESYQQIASSQHG
jgi:hypothetical protein